MMKSPNLSPISEGVTLLCCSYNRVDAIRDTIASKLEVVGVKELLFVLDGSTDESAAYLRQLSIHDNRLRVLEIEHGGVQNARNIGIKAAIHPWILLIDDDDYCSRDFLERLSASAATLSLDIVGAPWFNNPPRTDGQPPMLGKMVREMQLRHHPSTLTFSDVETPYLVSSFLGRAEALAQVGFDTTYKGNSWREETDFFLRALEFGFRVGRTSSTMSWLERRYSGGHKRNPLRYEYWVARNEVKFLVRHRHQLRSLQKLWLGVPLEVLRTLLPRLRNLLVGGLRRRVGSLFLSKRGGA